MSVKRTDLRFDWLSAGDVEGALEIEEQGYPQDEAATLQTLRYRQSKANELFLGVYLPDPRELIGYVCSTLSPSEILTYESMSNHVPSSSTVCIHSVCITPAHQRKGVGLRLLNEYLLRLEQQRADGSASYQRVALLAHEELRPFYERAGFQWIGKSDVVHGSRPWYEMRRILGPSPSVFPTQTGATLPPDQHHPETPDMPPRLWETLQRSSRSRPIPRLLSSFPGGFSDVITTDSAAQNLPLNKFDLLCPRSECASIILKRGVATWVERSSIQLEPPEYPPHTLLPSLPTPPATTQWWLITPSPMAFENIGFSRPVHAQHPTAQVTGKQLKLLSCAECDLGPLGWCEEGGSEFWLACTRVGYCE